MSDLLKLIIAKIISIILLVVVINSLFIILLPEVFSSTLFTITILLLNLFVIVDKIFQPFLLIGREKKNFMQAFFLILFLFANPFLFAYPFIEYTFISSVYYPSEVLLMFWVIGLFLLTFGGSLLCLSRFILGHNALLIIAIEKNQELITKGPYSIIRHPIYAGVLLLFLGFTLSFSSILGSIFITIPLFIVFRKRLVLEEQLLTETFGDEYQDYKKKTKRLVPFIY